MQLAEKTIAEKIVKIVRTSAERELKLTDDNLSENKLSFFTYGLGFYKIAFLNQKYFIC
ncbi:hypothetical protein [Methanosarcina barkeri]|uniref:hypothetical protein n=1 Tax=Methanosarcina barkeri TaxID=2208 RepID=UPI000AB2CC9A|nr:hypothetical protein [Methanosarcina barkeri]